MKLISIINQDFVSSCYETDQYKKAKRQFRNTLKRYFGKDNVILKSCPHFEFSGFITKNNRYVYFSTGDLRWRIMNSCLIRTAQHDHDWTGGSNNFVKYTLDFDEELIFKVNLLLTGE